MLFQRENLTTIDLRRSKQRDFVNALTRLVFTLTSFRNLDLCGTLCEIQNLIPLKSVPWTPVSPVTPLKTVSAMVSVFESGRSFLNECRRVEVAQSSRDKRVCATILVSRSHLTLSTLIIATDLVLYEYDLAKFVFEREIVMICCAL